MAKPRTPQEPNPRVTRALYLILINLGIVAVMALTLAIGSGTIKIGNGETHRVLSHNVLVDVVIWGVDALVIVNGIAYLRSTRKK